jgi:hypothetical protein
MNSDISQKRREEISSFRRSFCPAAQNRELALERIIPPPCQTSVFVDDSLDRLFECEISGFLQWQAKDTLGNSAHLSP